MNENVISLKGYIEISLVLVYIYRNARTFIIVNKPVFKKMQGHKKDSSWLVQQFVSNYDLYEKC